MSDANEYQNYLDSIRDVMSIPSKLTTLRNAEARDLLRSEDEHGQELRRLENEVELIDVHLTEMVSEARQLVDRIGLAELVSTELPSAVDRSATIKPQIALESLKAVAEEWRQTKIRDSDSKIEQERRQLAEKEARLRKKIPQGIVALCLTSVASFILAFYLTTTFGGHVFLAASGIGLVLGALLGNAVATVAHVSCQWSGLIRVFPSRSAGMISTFGASLLASAIGSIMAESDFSRTENAPSIAALGAFMMVVAFDMLPVKRMDEKQKIFLVPYLWDGWAGLIVGAPIILLTPLQPLYFERGIFLLVVVGVMFVAAAVRPIGLFARVVLGFVLGRLRELVSNFGVGKVRPGAIVWTWVAYDAVSAQGESGKDRPALVVLSNGIDLGVLPLTSKDHTYRNDVIALGRGSWDRENRNSFVKLDPLVFIRVGDIRRFGGHLDRRRYEMVLNEACRFHPVLRQTTETKTSTLVSSGFQNSAGFSVLWFVVAVLLARF